MDVVALVADGADGAAGGEAGLSSGLSSGLRVPPLRPPHTLAEAFTKRPRCHRHLRALGGSELHSESTQL